MERGKKEEAMDMLVDGSLCLLLSALIANRYSKILFVWSCICHFGHIFHVFRSVSLSSHFPHLKTRSRH